MSHDGQIDPIDPSKRWIIDHALAVDPSARDHWPGGFATSPGWLVLSTSDSLGALGAALGRVDLAALHRAAGVADLPRDRASLDAWFDAHEPGWKSLHATIPGWPLTHWRPEPAGTAGALSALDDGTLWLVRGVALGSLVRVASERNRSVDGGTVRALREELLSRVATAFSLDAPSTAIVPDPDLLWRRERALLRAAMLINCGDNHPHAVLRTWSLARWLHGVLALRGATGVVDLFAHEEISIEAGERDLLDPRWFIEREDSQSIVDFAITAGLTVGVLEVRVPAAIAAVAEPLVRSIANRCASVNEAEHESALHATRATTTTEHNALSWNLRQSVAPSFAARRLLTQWATPWLVGVRDDVFVEIIEAFERAPEFYNWFAITVWREGAALSSERRGRCVMAWRAQRADLPRNFACLMAAGLFDVLDEADVDAVWTMVDERVDEWSSALLDALGVAASRSKNGEQFRAVFERLHGVVTSEAVASTFRLNAMLVALRRWEEAPRDLRDPWTEKLRGMARVPVVQQREDLMRDVRRLGLHAEPPTKTPLARGASR